MKGLNWRFKKFPFSSKHLSRIKFNIITCSIVGFVIVSSCLHQQLQNQESGWSPLNLFEGSKSVAEQEFIHVSSGFKGENGQLLTVAALSKTSCDKDHRKGPVSLQWKVVLNSAFGNHTLFFQHDSLQTPSEISVSIEGKNLKIHSNESPSKDLVSKICVEMNSEKGQPIMVSQQEINYIQDWLKKVAPDCEVGFSNKKGWRCDLPVVEPVLANQELTDIQKTMVQRWSRQPYILARRLAIAKMLAKALESNVVNDELDTICRIIDHSTVDELPLTLATKVWQDTVCRLKNGERRDAANIGLAKSLSEIEFLRQLFQRTSRLGILAVRIPRDKAPTRDLWVSLKPSPSVVENLAKEMRLIWNHARSLEDTGHNYYQPCWHPVYGNDENNMIMAFHLDLTSVTDDNSCHPNHHQVQINGHLSSPEQYLAASITSETEFVITNGKTKLLRLPAGDYEYTIRGHIEGISEWEDQLPTQTAAGQVSWDSRRPQAIIKDWQEKPAEQKTHH